MSKPALSWSKLDWEDFQKVSLYLYKEQTGDLAAEEFLRQGHFQSGIDLLSFRQENGKHVCIQCKHSDLSLTRLKNIIALFSAGEFAATTETFIITTTADLQKPDIQRWITAEKVSFREQHAIAFDVWDRSRLEDSLRSAYRLVEKYFGKTEAKRHCFQPELILPELQSFPRYLTRNIQPATISNEDDAWGYREKERSVLTLTSVLAAPGENKWVCLIAEAYEGKSTLIRQTAWELSQLDAAVLPLVLDLKFCSIHPVSQLLDDHFASWLSVPAKNLVVLIDGLDEVPAEQFNTVVGHIRDFARNHPPVRLAFSCRAMFYNYQHLRHDLREFEFYELLDLHMKQILSVLEEQLGDWNSAVGFYTKMNGLGIAGLLGTPFYLLQMVKWFHDPTQEMPKTKIAIATRFVDESLILSGTRKMRSGLSLDKFKTKYRNALQKLALLLQIRGLNACDDESLQQLFNQEDIDLLTQSSILNIRNTQWSFINALFQEQLAALALQKLDAESVIKLITHGERIRKISRKWIQTLASYLSLLPETHADREKIVSVIEADNIELLALSEGSKFATAFRLGVLQKILQRTNRHQARLVVIDESNLAAFAGNDDLVVEELLKVLVTDTGAIVKIVACRTLRYLQLTASQADRYARLAKDLLIVTDNPELGRLLLEALAHYRLGDDDFLQEFLQNSLVETSHELRQGLYQYLASHDLVDGYYNWLLAGFPVLYNYNGSVSHYGSEKKLLDLVLTTRSGRHMRQLLLLIQDEPFQKYFRHDKDTTKAFYHELAEVCAKIYAEEPAIIFAVVNYLMVSGRNYYERQPNGMVEFLALTKTYSRGLRIALLSDKTGLQNYAFSGAIHPDCYGDIFYAVEEDLMSREEFNICCNGLYYSGRREEAESLESLAAASFGFKDEPSSQALSYQAIQVRKRNNDLLYLSSREAFRNGIIQLFGIAGSTTISVEELYERFDEDNPYITVNSTLLTTFISQLANDREATLNDCLEAVDNERHFMIWRAGQLMQSYIIQYYPELIHNYLKAYYDSELQSFSFAAITLDSPYLIRQQAGQLMKIWAEHQFPTSDDILLEFIRINAEGYGGIQFAEVNKRKSITTLLLKHFDDRKPLLKQRVLANLKNGLSDIGVIGTHLEFCRVLVIKEALPYILNFIRNKSEDTRYEDDFMSLYVLLGGAPEDLVPSFKSITDLNGYLFIFMVKLLLETHPTLVGERLLGALRSAVVSPERKIEAARYLAQLGDKEGFSYLFSKFEAGRPAPFDIQGNLKIWNVSTEWGLAELKPLMYLMLDEKTAKIRFHESPKDLLLETLHGFAAKSERDLEMVTTFMNQCAADLAVDYPKNAGHLGWHAEQMNERYREVNVIDLSNRKIKALFEEVAN